MDHLHRARVDEEVAVAGIAFADERVSLSDAQRLEGRRQVLDRRQR